MLVNSYVLGAGGILWRIAHYIKALVPADKVDVPEINHVCKDTVKDPRGQVYLARKIFSNSPPSSGVTIHLWSMWDTN